MESDAERDAGDGDASVLFALKCVRAYAFQ